MKKFTLILSFILGCFASQDVTSPFIEIAKDSAKSGAAASIALVPNFWFFMEKAKLQNGDTAARTPYKQALKSGVYAMPNTWATICTQIFVQKSSEKVLSQYIASQYLLFAGCFFGALASAPLYDVMNRQSMGQGFRTAIFGFFKKPLSTAPIIGREFAFLGSLRASQPIAQWMQDNYGKGAFVTNGTYFATGFIGSLFGHPFDTTLTFLQKGKPLSWNPRVLMRGSLTKSLGVGCFNILYQWMSE